MANHLRVSQSACAKSTNHLWCILILLTVSSSLGHLGNIGDFGINIFVFAVFSVCSFEVNFVYCCCFAEMIALICDQE